MEAGNGNGSVITFYHVSRGRLPGGRVVPANQTGGRKKARLTGAVNRASFMAIIARRSQILLLAAEGSDTGQAKSSQGKSAGFGRGDGRIKA